MTPHKHYYTKGLDYNFFPCVCEVVYLGEQGGQVLFRTIDEIVMSVSCSDCDFNDELVIARECAEYIKDWEKKNGGKANCELRKTHPYLFD